MTTIDKTEHLILQADNSSNIYMIKAFGDDNTYNMLTAIYLEDASNEIIMRSGGNNFQTYICTFDLFAEYIKLVDEAYDLLGFKEK